MVIKKVRYTITLFHWPVCTGTSHTVHKHTSGNLIRTPITYGEIIIALVEKLLELVQQPCPAYPSLINFCMPDKDLRDLPDS